MRRRSLISASLGLGALLGATGLNSFFNSSSRMIHEGYKPFNGLMMHSGSDLAFGTTVTIKLLHADPRVAQDAIADALVQVKKIDALMSIHQERSQVFALNKFGVLDSPDPQVLFVLRFAQQLAELTAGAFDITVQPLWQAFSLARAKGALPSSSEIDTAKALVNWRALVLEPHQVRFGAAGMGITLNGLAQGYAADLALEALRARGVEHALIDTGEHGAIGSKAHNVPWVLGVANPRRPETLSSTVTMDSRRVATSGDYAMTFSSDFVHHHIFDPASGESPPALASVTVVAPTGILADGLSTAMMVMGAERAFALAAQMPGVDIMLIDKKGSMQKTLHFPEA